jgi:hypothetical protein
MVAAVASVAVSATGRDFIAGNLVVSVVGDGSAALTSAATPVFLSEFTTGGSLVRSLALPTAASGLNHRFSNSGSATSECQLSRSADGRYLLLGGYDAAIGTASVVSTASASNARVVARIDMLDSIDTSTALSDAFTGNNVRSVCSTNGVDLWLGGTSSTGGVRYATLGASSSTSLVASPTNFRVVNIFGGQLYASSATGAFQGVSAIGSGTPTTAGQTATLLSGFPTASGPSNYDYWLADPNTMYVTDDRTNGSGGIEKWTFSGSTWSLQYTMAASPTQGLRSIVGTMDAASGQNLMYGITTDNKLVSVLDSGAASAFSILATAPANTAFRGVEFAPIPAPGSLALLAISGLVATRRRR